jgi:hypothetical protein
MLFLFCATVSKNQLTLIEFKPIGKYEMQIWYSLFCAHLCLNQCCGPMTIRDPAISISDLQDDNKKLIFFSNIFLLITF